MRRVLIDSGVLLSYYLRWLQAYAAVSTRS